MRYNIKRLNPDIVKRHIAILELVERSFGAAEISRRLDLTDSTVNNTIKNHSGKLAELKDALRQLEGGNTEDKVENSSAKGGDQVVGSSGEIVVEAGDVGNLDNEVKMTNDEVKVLWTNLLEIISKEGFSSTDDWYEAVINRLGLNDREELSEMLDMLFDAGYLRKFEVPEEDGEEGGSFYLVSKAGQPIASREAVIEIQGEEGMVKEYVDDDEYMVPENGGLAEGSIGANSHTEQESPENTNDIYRMLKYISGPGSIRLISESLSKLQEHLGVDDVKLREILREAQTKGYLEDNDRGGLRITPTGSKYIDENKWVLVEDRSENDPKENLLAAE